MQILYDGNPYSLYLIPFYMEMYTESNSVTWDGRIYMYYMY